MNTHNRQRCPFCRGEDGAPAWGLIYRRPSKDCGRKEALVPDTFFDVVGDDFEGMEEL